MKKILVFLCALGFMFFQGGLPAKAENEKPVYFFYGDGCPHCAKELAFLQKIQKNYTNLEIKTFEIYRNRDNALFLQKVGEALSADVSGVPFLVVGDKYFIGYSDGVTSSQIESQIKICYSGACPDPIADISRADSAKKYSKDEFQNNGDEKIINLPFLGEIDANKFSLPVLTIFMGFLDGFNPCALWTLLFLISLLLGIKDRKRMWILGMAFIVASAGVYFMFMSAWLNLVLFLGFVIWVRISIGILALFGGGYNLKKFIFKKGDGCEVANTENRQKIFQKLKDLVSKNSFWVSLLGIFALAFMVNLVELICSAGLPAIYTQVLALNDLSGLQYYLYILLYIFFFMLDDLFIFFVAMTTLEMTGISTKYSRCSQLIGGILMLAIGVLLIFKPGWLMFG